MIKEYPCPICNRRACDSNKTITISKLSDSNSEKADIIIKCKNCKNILAVKISNENIVCKIDDSAIIV